MRAQADVILRRPWDLEVEPTHENTGHESRPHHNGGGRERTLSEALMPA